MGHVLSREECEKADLDRFVKSLKDGPDLGVDKHLVMYTSQSSTDNLRRHYETRKMQAADCAADWIKNLAEKLAAFAQSAEIAGLGALAIAIIIDMVSFSPPEESIEGALRSVLAEEKTSEVWDLIDECLKRFTMHFENRNKLRSDLERIESQLSVALTKLKNSMVRDGHMSSQSLKGWVNGAAFHIQMLIHLERLGENQTCNPIQSLIAVYQRDLDPLFEKHKEMIKGKCSRRPISLHPSYDVMIMQAEDSECYRVDPDVSYDKYFEAYYDHRYHRQKLNIQEYFSDIGQNLPQLVRLTGSFSV
ncbi:uncharacterized protein LOC132954328 [Labrus mixtus]|uniref:uncharacterized protein LOC132954328 n=1 Tax=Labrus mixtus TaxID=508554 RepID=UPI0029BFE127|nr:uncharacterized protein LOC132954328 [Labrus mixtus]